MEPTIFYGGQTDTLSGDSDSDFLVNSDDPGDELPEERDESETDKRVR